MKKKQRPSVVRTRPAGDEHRVVTVQGGTEAYRRWPCGGDESTPDRPGCPWRVDATGRFPAEAFAHSAETAYDQSNHTFACHEAGVEHPATCAGFLLRGAEHNIAIRLGTARGRIDLDEVHDGGHELHADYRSMAVANGLDADDPRLRDCR